MLAAAGRLSGEPQIALLTESFVSVLRFISFRVTVMSLPSSSFVSIVEHLAAFFFFQEGVSFCLQINLDLTFKAKTSFYF